jgi:hypothetical protein
LAHAELVRGNGKLPNKKRFVANCCDEPFALQVGATRRLLNFLSLESGAGKQG